LRITTESQPKRNLYITDGFQQRFDLSSKALASGRFVIWKPTYPGRGGGGVVAIITRSPREVPSVPLRRSGAWGRRGGTLEALEADAGGEPRQAQTAHPDFKILQETSIAAGVARTRIGAGRTPQVPVRGRYIYAAAASRENASLVSSSTALATRRSSPRRAKPFRGSEKCCAGRRATSGHRRCVSPFAGHRE